MIMKRFVITFTITLLMGLLLIGCFVYLEDPFFHYHVPYFGEEAYMDYALYQTPGAADHLQYDAVIVGSSMTENFRASWFDEMDLKLLKLSYSGAEFKDYETILEHVFNSGNDIKFVLTDINEFQLLSDVDAVYKEYPEYLYNKEWYDDTEYLYNNDVFWRAMNQVTERVSGNQQREDDSYTWEDAELFSEERARQDYNTCFEDLMERCTNGTYERLTKEDMLVKCEENMDYLIQITARHPETEFVFFYPPYSVLFWEEAEAEEEVDDILEMYYATMKKLLGCENVLVFNFQTNEGLVMDLNRYRDVCHHDPQGNREIYECIRDTMRGEGEHCGEYLVTEENLDVYIDSMKDILTRANQ